jgi:hypothetical protein
MPGLDAVDALEFTQKTGKRAVYEDFEFRPQGSGDVVVENQSHGDDGEDHSYTVHVVSGLPADCTCPADEYHEGACKHRVALAMSPAVIEAAEAGQDQPLAADGGDIIVAGDEGEVLDDGADQDDQGDSDGAVMGRSSRRRRSWAGQDREGEESADGPTYTYHTEPEFVGGARYVRCERCGAESVPADPDRILHDEGCPEGRR